MKTLHVLKALSIIILFFYDCAEGIVVSSATYRALYTTIHHATRIKHFQTSPLQVTNNFIQSLSCTTKILITLFRA